jgi:class 3 adenylate cyclase
MYPGISTLPGGQAVLETARVLEERHEAAEIYDASWRLSWVSSELKRVLGGPSDLEIGIGKHVLELFTKDPWRSKVSEASSLRALEVALPYYLHDCQQETKKFLPPSLSPLLETTEPQAPPPLWAMELEILQEGSHVLEATCFVFPFQEGDFRGFLRLYASSLPASLLALIARGSQDMFQRMSRLVEPGRHPVAVLFTDIQESTDLARRLPSALYFEVLSTLAARTDQIVGSHNGIIGKHVGDGSSAYFLADDHGQTSAAVRAAIVADRQIREAASLIAQEIVEKHQLEPFDLQINSGMHWGATVYLGQIVSGGRLEVSALGDEINECARLQEAAQGGRSLVSKSFLERLDEKDASCLGIDLLRQKYFPLGEMGAVSDKSKRDIGALPVCFLRDEHYQE